MTRPEIKQFLQEQALKDISRKIDRLMDLVVVEGLALVALGIIILAGKNLL